jgi:predicted small secreted protein
MKRVRLLVAAVAWCSVATTAAVTAQRVGQTDSDAAAAPPTGGFQRGYLPETSEGCVWCFGTYWPKAHEPAA